MFKVSRATFYRYMADGTTNGEGVTDR